MMFFRRFASTFKALDLPLKVGTTGICCLLGYGLVSDAIRMENRGVLALSIAFWIVFFFLIVEAVNWFEFKAVKLFDYKSDVNSEMRDQRLGRLFIRLLLILGNATLLIKILRYH